MTSKQVLTRLASAAAVTLAMLSGAAHAGPVDVTYTVSGSTGNWFLDFTVTNNMLGTTQDVYFFGVQLGARDIVGSPSGYDSNSWTAWSNTSYGGSSMVYNNNWIGYGSSHLTPGLSFSGFKVHSIDAIAPTGVNWFAYGSGSSYTGDHFNGNTNPGFEGRAGLASAAVPEPTSIALVLAGLVGAGAISRRRRAA